MIRPEVHERAKEYGKGLSMILLCIMLLLLASCEDTGSSTSSATEAQNAKPSYEVEQHEPIDTTAEEAPVDADTPDETSGDSNQDPRDGMSEDEYLVYLSGTIPYVGMSEDYIDKTACGEHTDTGDFSGKLGYRWSFDDLHALVVKVDGGKVIDVNPIHEDLFWDEDMPHLEEIDGEKVWKPIPGALHKRWEEHEARRDKSVDDFETAEEYADYYHDDFLDVMLAEEYYDKEIDDLVVLEQSYLDAIDHWYQHQPWPEPEE